MTDDLNQLLSDLDDRVAAELTSTPDVVDKGHDLDPDNLPIDARRWHKATDVVAVVSDLKSSTLLGLNKHAASTASIYEAATGGGVEILNEFDADFIAIQGDGAFGLFWGDRALARAVCAGITLKTFSARELVPRLEAKWEGLKDIETGFKVGIATSDVLVKRVGISRTKHNEPVWAGKAVNYAAKCAQQAARHEMIVTGTVWDFCEANDYLAVSCGCGGVSGPSPSGSIWKDVEVEKLPNDDPERQGRLLTSLWCVEHGAAFCAAVLAGERSRADVTDQRAAVVRKQQENALRVKARHARASRRGLAKVGRR